MPEPTHRSRRQHVPFEKQRQAVERQIRDGYIGEAHKRWRDNVSPGRSLLMRLPSASFPAKGGDPLLDGIRDAADECEHGRLPGDRSEPCGCWPIATQPEDPVVRRCRWSRDELLIVLAAAFDELGRVPSQREWMDLHLPPSYMSILRACGSWAEAVEACGHPRPMVGRPRKDP
jgi:hypothetical protein